MPENALNSLHADGACIYLIIFMLRDLVIQYGNKQ